MNNPTLKLYLGPGSGNTANSLIADNNPEIETGFDVNNNQPYQKIYFNPWENGEQYRQLHQMLIDPSTISKITHLGGGEYGKTYRGIYTHECKHGEKIQEDVCIKILKNTEQSLEAIEECKKMFKLDHRFILPTYGLVCTKTESPMIIMPYMIYKDLEKTLQTRKNKENDFTNHQLYHFCSQIADGMAFLTFKGLTHRDLATRNCVITESDYSLKNNLKYYHVRIADLGLTEDRTDASQLNSVNTEHLGYIEENKQLKLPLKWLAPEIVKTMTFNEQTDVWAFGVTVWEILEKGETPYKGLNPGQAMQQVNEGLRLPRPVNCTDMIWNMLTTDCWNANPSLRRYS